MVWCCAQFSVKLHPCGLLQRTTSLYGKDEYSMSAHRLEADRAGTANCYGLNTDIVLEPEGSEILWRDSKTSTTARAHANSIYTLPPPSKLSERRSYCYEGSVTWPNLYGQVPGRRRTGKRQRHMGKQMCAKGG